MKTYFLPFGADSLDSTSNLIDDVHAAFDDRETASGKEAWVKETDKLQELLQELKWDLSSKVMEVERTLQKLADGQI